MKFVGILVVLGGWMITILSVGLTESTGARMLMVILGIAVSLGGILGILNKAHQKNAVWKA